ncbi:CHI3L1 [Acrasis kona]|uniref:CHI3L1 n=1 Tax=Acrasis kona TaxID=1008807 RepID=A0AAW2YVV0_9EUKA
MSIESQFQSVLDSLKKNAPNLSPKIIPRGYDDNNLALFCPGKKEKEHLSDAIKKNEPTVCDTKNCGLEAQLTFTTLWSIQIQSKTYVLEGGQYLCPKCEKCVSLEKIITKSSDDNYIESLKHFASVNQLQDSDLYQSQRLYNDAYTLQILTCSIPQFKVAVRKGNKIEPITEGSHTVEDLLTILFNKDKEVNEDSSDDDDDDE